MQPIFLYLKLGYEHIANFTGADHIMFLVALCAVYPPKDWKRVLLLVTAFTLGHSITLALSALDVVIISSKVIKFLIPLTILLTALHNIVAKPSTSRWWIIYMVTLFFGCIHGLDFSNYFKALLMGSQSVLIPLLGFNIGIELAQILVVLCILGIAYLSLIRFKIALRDWTLFVSGAAAGIAIKSMIDNWPFI